MLARSRRYSSRVAELHYNKRYMHGSLLPQRAHYAANAVVVPAGKKKATPLFLPSVGPAQFPGWKKYATVCVATILETATIQAELEAEQGDSTRAKTPFAIGSATRAGREWALCPDTGEAYTYAVDDVSRQLARGGMDFDPCVLPSSRVCRSGGKGMGGRGGGSFHPRRLCVTPQVRAQRDVVQVAGRWSGCADAVYVGQRPATPPRFPEAGARCASLPRRGGSLVRVAKRRALSDRPGQ